MKLDEARRDYLVDTEEETTRMSISSDVESHIIKVLTEHSYDDPLGSSIREAVSNAIDSVTEAGTNIPVIVSIQTNEAGYKELIIEDKGLGLDDVSFKKYIMGLGESTKRNSATLLGGYGAGSKAWLSYTDNFSYICRKDGIERRYLIFKGEEFPECTLIYEKETDEPNGVTIIVALKNGWNEETVCKNKIRGQLSYLDNVFFNIPDFQNSYKIYRHQHYQYCEDTPYSEMHISLKNIYYPINWNQIGISRIPIPIALKFDDYEDLKPVFNRENLTYNSKSINAIKNKIKLAAEEFIEKVNSENVEYDSLAKNYRTLKNKQSLYSFCGKMVDLSFLVNISGKQLRTFSVKNISLQPLHYYLRLPQSVILSRWDVVGYLDTDRSFTYKPSAYQFNSEIIDRSNYDKVDDSHPFNPFWQTSAKVVIVDFTLSGYVKDCLKEKYKRNTYFVKDRGYKTLEQSFFIHHDLKIPENTSKEDIELFLYEYNTITDQYKETFIDESGFIDTLEFSAWKEERRKLIKEGKIKGTSNYKALNKEQGEVTISQVKYSERAKEDYVLVKSKIKIEDLARSGGLFIYSTEVNNKTVLYARMLPKVKFIKVNKNEEKYFKNKNQFIHMSKFDETKTFKRLATACFIKSILNKDNLNDEVFTVGMKQIKEQRKTLREYLYQSSFNVYNEDAERVIIDKAFQTNDWDMSIYPLAVEYYNKTRLFDFISLFKIPAAYDSNRKEKIDDIRKVLYVMATKLKMDATFLQNYELVEKVEVNKELEQIFSYDTN